MGATQIRSGCCMQRDPGGGGDDGLARRPPASPRCLPSPRRPPSLPPSPRAPNESPRPGPRADCSWDATSRSLLPCCQGSCCVMREGRQHDHASAAGTPAVMEPSSARRLAAGDVASFTGAEAPPRPPLIDGPIGDKELQELSKKFSKLQARVQRVQTDLASNAARSGFEMGVPAADATRLRTRPDFSGATPRVTGVFDMDSPVGSPRTPRVVWQMDEAELPWAKRESLQDSDGCWKQFSPNIYDVCVATGSEIRVMLNNRPGVLAWDGRPEEDLVQVRWSDTGVLSQPVPANEIIFLSVETTGSRPSIPKLSLASAVASIPEEHISVEEPDASEEDLCGGDGFNEELSPDSSPRSKFHNLVGDLATPSTVEKPSPMTNASASSLLEGDTADSPGILSGFSPNAATLSLSGSSQFGESPCSDEPAVAKLCEAQLFRASPVRLQ